MKKLVVVIAAVALLAGCGSEGDPADTAAPDSGVEQCRKLATTDANDKGVPTDEEIKAVRDAYENSQHTDLRRAGLKHLALVEEYYDTGNRDFTGIMTAKAMLVETCAKHGVVVPEPSFPAPSFEVPPMANPYEN